MACKLRGRFERLEGIVHSLSLERWAELLWSHFPETYYGLPQPIYPVTCTRTQIVSVYRARNGRDEAIWHPDDVIIDDRVEVGVERDFRGNGSHQRGRVTRARDWEGHIKERIA